MIDTYGSMIPSINNQPVEISHDAVDDATATTKIQESLKGLVDKLTKKEDKKNKASEQNKTKEKEEKEDKDIHIKINYELYPFLFLVIDTILNITNPSKNHQKHKVLALKTIRKIELLKTPAWVDVMYNYYNYIMGKASDIAIFENILDYRTEMKNIEDSGKQGARIFMDIHKDNSDDRKITKEQCNQTNTDKIVDYRIKHYNADPIKSANHALNSIFYENYLKNKLGEKNSNSKGIPFTTQIDDILLNGISSDSATGIDADKNDKNNGKNDKNNGKNDKNNS